MKENTVVPFVGAGFSISFGYPGWSDFLLTEARKARKLGIVRTLIGGGRFEEAAECLANGNPAEFHRILCNTFAFGRPLDSREAAVFCLPRLSRGPVITTNFDTVLERVYDQAARLPFRHIVYASAGAGVGKVFELREHSLIKLHGDATNPHTRILTQSEYSHHYGDTSASKPEPLVVGLQMLMLRGILLFLGCSLLNDRHLSVLRSTVARTAIRHYAVLAEPTERKSKAYNQALAKRVAALDEANIDPIWYPHGRHECIRALLEHIASTLGHAHIDHCCPDHAASGQPLSISFQLEVSGRMDLLRCFENLRRDPTHPLARFSNAFSSFRPFNISGEPTRFEISLEEGAIVLNTYPKCKLEDHSMPETFRILPSPTNPSYQYWPRGDASPEPLSFSSPKPNILVLSEWHEKSFFTLNITLTNSYA